MTIPLFAIHRRNRIDQLNGLPKGCWVEIDIEIHEGNAFLVHDPLAMPPLAMTPPLDKLQDFVPAALAAGIDGFIVDCKRENASKIVQPLLNKHQVKNYFYLNEMEVQADIYQSQDAKHSSAIRIWKYRNADGVIHLVNDAKKDGQGVPQWVWVDCWQRGLLSDIQKANLPLTQAQAKQLQALGVKLCICSPELYVHKYDTIYETQILEDIYQGVVSYRAQLEKAGIKADMICGKFAWLWENSLSDLQNGEGMRK